VVAAVLMVLSSLTLIFSSTRVGHCLAGATPSEEEPFSGAPAGAAVRSSPVATTLNDTPEGMQRARIAGFSSSLQRGGWGVGLLHFLSLASQAVAFLLLVESLREPLSAALLVAGFALAGATLAFAWKRFALPHWVDMCIGMLTLGNLGMLLGWWADAGFAPLHDGGCCACVEAMRSGLFKPWMWAGMLAGGNAAMLRLTRTRPRGAHARAMFTGGNAGMVLGMAAGGGLAAQVEVASVAAAVAMAYAGMTAGMLAGMLAGTWLAERLGAGLAAVGFVPRWWRVTSSRTP
jgi:hypothetical protein